MPAPATAPLDVDAALLRGWPLPMPLDDGDKEARGHLLIVGGAREMPGALILAATAALRAGAGKLSLATGASVAPLVGLAVPEARVLALAENDAGGFHAQAGAARLAELAGKVDAVLIGPGMLDDAAAAALTHALLPLLAEANIILDAAAMNVVRPVPEPHALTAPEFRFARPALLTPHAGEMAHLIGIDKDQILAEPRRAAVDAAHRWNAVLALKGAQTLIAAPGGQLWRHTGGNIGLAISGSGDTLAGIIAGLAARGATLEQAAAWGVAVHALAGEQLALRVGTLGYLAREIAAEIPALLRAFGPG
jgi:ADP-dependent NAD(P)H-hydrate dehydratase